MRLASLVSVLSGLLILQSAAATTFYERSPEEMALAADMIFVGTVDSLRQSGTAETPWTTVTFAVEEWLALEGQAIDREDPPDDPPLTVELDFLGGGGLTVSGLPQFRERDRLLLFAYDDAGLASPIVGVSQGVWTLDARGAQDAAGAYLRVPAPGRLLTDSVGSGVEELLVAISELLADGTLPGPLEPERSEESPEEAADGAADEAAEEAAEDAAEETAEDAAEDPTEPAEPVDDPEAAQDPEGAPDPADDPPQDQPPPPPGDLSRRAGVRPGGVIRPVGRAGRVRHPPSGRAGSRTPA